jgi:hypothetical protein
MEKPPTEPLWIGEWGMPRRKKIRRTLDGWSAIQKLTHLNFRIARQPPGIRVASSVRVNAVLLALEP